MNIIPNLYKDNSDLTTNTYLGKFTSDAFQDYVDHRLASKAYKYVYDPVEWGYGKRSTEDFNLRDAFRFYFASFASGAQGLKSEGRFVCESNSDIVDWSIY